jgi:hypothetical protein
MQQLMAQQQQQQQQMYITSGIGSRNSSANIRTALNAMDAGSRDGGSMHYTAVQQDACWSPRACSAAGIACNKFDTAGAAAGGSHMGSSNGYAPTQSSWQRGYQAGTPANAAGSLDTAAVARGKRDSCSPAAGAGYGSSVPKPVGAAAFSSSKGAFGGKTIVQPPGEEDSLQLLEPVYCNVIASFQLHQVHMPFELRCSGMNPELTYPDAACCHQVGGQASTSFEEHKDCSTGGLFLE